MTRFEAGLREQQRQTAAVLLGQLYAQAALLKVSQDEGEGFYVSALDVERMLSFDRDHKERLAGLLNTMVSTPLEASSQTWSQLAGPVAKSLCQPVPAV